jgi:hypothetical protein
MAAIRKTNRIEKRNHAGNRRIPSHAAVTALLCFRHIRLSSFRRKPESITRFEPQASGPSLRSARNDDDISGFLKTFSKPLIVKEHIMEKRKRHNLLLIAAVITLLIGALVQVYLIVTAKQEPAAETSSETLSQPQ